MALNLSKTRDRKVPESPSKGDRNAKACPSDERDSTPRHKTNTCRKKILGNYFLREYMRGLYSHSREYRKIFSTGHVPEYCAKFLGEFIRCEYMPRLYSHPRECRKIFLANYLCIGFVPDSIGSGVKNHLSLYSSVYFISVCSLYLFAFLPAV